GGKYHLVAIADIADDHVAGVDADAESDWFPFGFGKHCVQMIDIASDHRCGIKRLAARGSRIGVKPEQRQQTVAEILVRLTARFGYSLRHGGKETVDDEHSVERQPFVRHCGGAAHIDKHAHYKALFAGSNIAPAIDE